MRLTGLTGLAVPQSLLPEKRIILACVVSAKKSCTVAKYLSKKSSGKRTIVNAVCERE
jgi:hypothetical protein